MAVPGGTYLVTRTTVMSLYLLTPNRVLNQIFEYCLAWAAQNRGILLHAASVESNHFHLVVTDTLGKLSEFVQELDRCLARCLLEYYRAKFPTRRLEALWSPAKSFGATLLVNANAVLDKIVYTLTNPVKDGLVHDYRKWPGVNTRPSAWRGGSCSVSRPAYYFKNTHEKLEYQLVPPSQLDCGDIEQLIADVESHIRQRQSQAAVGLAAQKHHFKGVKAVLRTDPFDSPTTPRPAGNLDPQIAAGRDGEALRLATKAIRTFRAAYREACALFKRGIKTVFPGGTLLMQRRFNVPCDPLDASCWCQLAAT
jgi:REP element-mobilizing transposase RayT